MGCANPGPPAPPSLHLPALVADLTAERNGDRVLLSWTTPSLTSDGIAIKGPMIAQICRESGERAGTALAATSAPRTVSCGPVLRLAVTSGPSSAVDTLPSGLSIGPASLLAYRIQILNSIEHSAGDSAATYAAAGAAPSPVDSLKVTASQHGAVVQWAAPADRTGNLVEITRTSPWSPPVTASPPKPGNTRHANHGKPAVPANSAPQGPVEVHLRATEPPAGTVDTFAKFGETYTYFAERIRPVTLGQHSLEIRSGPSSPVTIALRDSFPPGVPAGLATISGTNNGTPYIDLSWEPNAEPDLAGYFVYRQLARPNGDPQGVPVRLTPSPVTAPAYRDVAVSPGQGYIYWVTAVDASGNESAPSAKAQEVVTPE